MSTNRIILTTVLFFFIKLSCFAQGIVPDATERAVLNALYAGLGGTYWTNKTNWTTDKIAQFPSIVPYGVTITNGDITSIVLNNNGLSGTLPSTAGSSLNDLTALITLDLGANYINDPMPSLGSLVNLQKLDLSNHSFTGSLGAWIGNLTQLTYLDLSSNSLPSNDIYYFYGLPSQINNLGNLSYFDFSFNDLSGGLPNMNGLNQLKTLKLRFSKLNSSNNSLVNISNISSLNYLDLYFNNIQYIPSNTWSSLISADLSFNPQLDWNTLSNLLTSQVTLKNLYIQGCNLSNVPDLSALTLLEDFRADANKLDHIPNFLLGLTKLVRLSLGQNLMTGSLPEGLFVSSSAKLKYLYLNNNKLSGALPISLNSLINLSELDLSYNQYFSGVVPPLTALTSLQVLNLNNNQLSGSITNILSVTALNRSNISNNQFSGTVPPSFSNGFQIDVSNNNFTGWAIPNQYLHGTSSSANLNGNFFDFGDIEPNFDASGNKVFTTLTYANQKSNIIGQPQTVEAIEGTSLSMQNMATPPATHNIYEWQKFDGTNWNTVQAAPASGYYVANVTKSIAGIYRMVITNSWVTDLTFYSANITVVVLPPLCDSYIPAMAGSFKMDKVTGAIVFDRNDCTQDIPLTCLYGPAQSVNNVVGASATLYSDNWDDGITSNNPFLSGEREWRKKSAFNFNTKINYQSNATNFSAGVYSYKPFNWYAVDGSQPYWLKAAEVEKYSAEGEPVQERNALKIPSATRFGYDGAVPYLIAQNAEYDNVVFESFEKTYGVLLEDNISYNPNLLTSSTAHSGVNSLQLIGPISFRSVTTQGKDIKLRFWLSGDVSPGNVSVTSSSGNAAAPVKIATSGFWSLWESTITLPGPSAMVTLSKGSGGAVYLDDVRLQPVDAEMTCYVYDPRTLRLLAVFDDRHFGMYYQYNEEGKLIRKRIETKNGIKTIQETQYNLPTQAK